MSVTYVGPPGHNVNAQRRSREGEASTANPVAEEGGAGAGEDGEDGGAK